MRLLALVAVACTACMVEQKRCPIEWRSNERNTPGLVTSSDRRATFVFNHATSVRPIDSRVGAVFPDGTIIASPAPDKNRDTGFIVAGAESTLWHKGCATKTATIDRADATSVEIPTPAGADTAAFVFEGAGYRMLWLTPGMLHHRAVAEDGTLGDVQDVPLAVATRCATRLVYDGAHTIYFRADTSFALDLEANTIAPVPLFLDRSFMFAGQLHTLYRDEPRIAAYDVSTGLVLERELPFDRVATVAASRTHLYLSRHGGEVIELDANLAVVSRWVAPTGLVTAVAILDGDLVRFERVDIEEGAPGHVDLVRVQAGTAIELWRATVASDSAPIPVEECDQ
jgi:hypothetical protein